MRKTRLYLVPPVPGEQGAESKTMKILRRKMREVKTQAQFEAILLDAHEDHRHKMRELLEPMLPEGLPCCGTAQLCAVARRPLRHTALCPKARLVTLH